jgi:hypothetical protein
MISLVLSHLPLFYFRQLTAACCTPRTHVCKKKIIEYIENIPSSSNWKRYRRHQKPDYSSLRKNVNVPELENRLKLAIHRSEAVDMNGRFQMQGGKNWILPK